MLLRYEFARVNKLLWTLRICASLFMARTFGAYIHTEDDNGCLCARYRWRGKEWLIPLEACEATFAISNPDGKPHGNANHLN